MTTALTPEQIKPVDYQILILGNRWTHCAKHIYESSEDRSIVRALYDEATVKPLQLRIEALEAELAACKRDAERYRWLRDMDEDPGVSLAAIFTDMQGSAISISKRIDAAIDAAMAAQEKA